MSEATPDSLALLEALVARRLGARVESVLPLAPGLGTRRFFRLVLSPGGPDTPRSLIARVDAPEDPARRPGGAPPEPPLEPIRAFLERSGIPVPRSHGRDPESGVELLEDVGDTSLEQAVTDLSPAQRRELYAETAGWVVRLQALSRPDPPIAAFDRRLDETQIAYKAERLIRFGLPALLRREPTAGEVKIVREGFARIADACREAPLRLSHRDLKAANVHLRDGAPPGARIVLIDLQGAFLAPPEYDLVCLFHDAHVVLPVSEIDAQLAAIRPRLPDAPPRDEFARRFHLLTLSRVGKDASLYLYASSQLGDHRYLRFVPRAVRILRASAQRAARLEPSLARLADLLAALEEEPCAR